jgi:hypothetical protein
VDGGERCGKLTAVRVPKAPVEGLGEWGQLGEGDTVEVDGRRYLISGWIAYDDEWVEYLLDDGRWLCVEDDGGLRFSLWEDEDRKPPGSGPALVVDGVTYRRIETYRARWLAAGVEGLTGPGDVTVVEYAGEDGALAALEDWGDGDEPSLGHVLPPETVSR